MTGQPGASSAGQAAENDYGPECVIELANGSTIRTDTYDSNPAGSSYVRVCSPGGHEVAYWTYPEWAEDPQLVMGAILGAASTPGAGQPHSPVVSGPNGATAGRAGGDRSGRAGAQPDASAAGTSAQREYLVEYEARVSVVVPVTAGSRSGAIRAAGELLPAHPVTDMRLHPACPGGTELRGPSKHWDLTWVKNMVTGRETWV